MQAIVESGLWPSTLTTIPSLYVSQQVLGGTELVWPFCKVFEIITGASKKDYFVPGSSWITGSQKEQGRTYWLQTCDMASVWSDALQYRQLPLELLSACASDTALAPERLR